MGFILLGKVFWRVFRVLGSDERKGKWVVEQGFHGIIWVKVTCDFAFFSGAFIESCSLCYGLKDLFTHPCTDTLTKLSLTIKTDDIRSSRSDLDCIGGKCLSEFCHFSHFNDKRWTNRTFL